MKSNVSTPTPLVPMRVRSRVARELFNGLREKHGESRGFSMRWLEKYGAFLAVTPTGGNGYVNVVLDEIEAAEIADFILNYIADDEAVPMVASRLDYQRSQHESEIRRMEHEINVLRWRVLHLEREAQRTIPPYSDATALVLVKGGGF